MNTEPPPEVCYRPECPRTDLLRDRRGRLRVFRIPAVVDETGRVEVYADCYSCPLHQPMLVIVDE